MLQHRPKEQRQCNGRNEDIAGFSGAGCFELEVHTRLDTAAALRVPVVMGGMRRAIL
jgi:hypothetical protein